MKKKFGFIVLGLLAVFFICASMKTASAEEISTAVPPQMTEEASLPLLRVGDQLRLYVYGDDDLTGEYRIDTRGILTLPLVGEITAQELNKKQLEEKIAEKLISGGYYNDPKVTIDVSALQPFYILGEVKNPGSYQFSADLDVFKAIAIAGGYTPRADKGDIAVMRKVDGQKVKIKATEDTSLLPGDSIKVEQRFF